MTRWLNPGHARWASAVVGLAAGLLMAFGVHAASNPASGQTSGPALKKLQDVVNGNHRTPEQKARDVYRHPVETLAFFGIRPDMTVVELWPFGGWYTAILAPYVKGTGKYYAAAMDPESKNRSDIKYNSELKALLEAHPDLYSEVQWSVLAPGKFQIAPDGSADMVLTFRNIHNWAWQGMEKDVMAAAFRALKPGGILGVVEHRNNDPNYEPKQPGNAYVGEEYTVKLAEAAGFQLVGRSDINRNPKDTKDYPKGVWTLPPTYALGDTDRAKYAAIGESDRFTLKFVKPAK
ncbi:MAG: class I SAM-dependent methyltransferase [Steroidobacteraceae bacterium]|nr:class I SAM-dependent methyltransferase [Steroidobacteraceae bacterium]